MQNRFAKSMMLSCVSILLIGCHNINSDLNTDSIILLSYENYRSTAVAHNDGILLAAAHAIPDNTIHIDKINIGNSRRVTNVLIDGWKTIRTQDDVDFLTINSGEVRRDHLLLSTDPPITPLNAAIPQASAFDQTLAKCDTYFVISVHRNSKQPETIKASNIVYDTHNGVISIQSDANPSSHYLSGSPLVGLQPDGNYVLLGIISGYGEVPINSRNTPETSLACPIYYFFQEGE